MKQLPMYQIYPLEKLRKIACHKYIVRDLAEQSSKSMLDKKKQERYSKQQFQKVTLYKTLTTQKMCNEQFNLWDKGSSFILDKLTNSEYQELAESSVCIFSNEI